MIFKEDRNSCYRLLVDELSEKYRRREVDVAELFASEDKDAMLRRAEHTKSKLRKALLDQEIPLGIERVEAKGQLNYKGCIIEKHVIYANSGSVIPVNIYRPDQDSGLLPGIVMSTGHAVAGKEYVDTQNMSLNLASAGFVVASYDPVCQGERRLFSQRELDTYFANEEIDLLTVGMHTQPGNLAYMLEKSLAGIFVSDSMAVVDYLCSRADVDVEKIGATGRSGGGTQTLYLSACDDRIKTCSPIQCLSKNALMCISGVGDCEQSLLNISASEGYDYPDQVWASFPKPVFMNAALYDAFPVQGARETEAELRRLYALAADSKDFDAGYASCAHETSPETVQMMLDWFCARFLGKDAPNGQAFEPLSDGQLRCLNSGHEADIPSRIYHSMLRSVQAKRPQKESDIKSALAELVDWNKNMCAVEWLDDKRVDFICTEGPFRQICSLKRGGKKLRVVIAPEFYEIEEDGASILEISPWGIDSAYTKRSVGYDSDSKLFMVGALYGNNILSLRVRQIRAAIDFVIKENKYSSVELVGVGAGAIPVLLVSCLQSGIDKVRLGGLVPSYEYLFSRKAYRFPETNILPGLLKYADIPELLKMVENVELFECSQLLPYDADL